MKAQGLPGTANSEAYLIQILLILGRIPVQMVSQLLINLLTLKNLIPSIAFFFSANLLLNEFVNISVWI
jgi:hypothetical protein